MASTAPQYNHPSASDAPASGAWWSRGRRRGTRSWRLRVHDHTTRLDALPNACRLSHYSRFQDKNRCGIGESQSNQPHTREGQPIVTGRRHRRTLQWEERDQASRDLSIQAANLTISERGLPAWQPRLATPPNLTINHPAAHRPRAHSSAAGWGAWTPSPPAPAAPTTPRMRRTQKRADTNESARWFD
jgi:hypothetical protein